MVSEPTTDLPPALQSVRLSEFGGIEVGWAMCRNRMCENFGILYGSDAGAHVHPRYEVVYHQKTGEIDHITCRYCTADIPLYSVQSLRPIARHFLSECLPFDDCPREDCENHGRNVFESLGPKASGGPRRASPYHVNGERLKCYGRRRSTGRRCGKSINMGTLPPDDNDDPKRQWLVSKCLLLIRLGLSGTHANGIDINTEVFNNNRARFGACFRDYQAYRNSFLLKPGWCGQEEKTATVLTDVLHVSLKRFGNVGRTQRLSVIVSVLRLRYRIKDNDDKGAKETGAKEDKTKETTTWFVLAAHPYYLPQSKCPSVADLEIDVEDRPKSERRFAGLNHFLRDMRFVHTKRPRKRKKSVGETSEGSDEETTEGSDGETTEGSDGETDGQPEKERGTRVISDKIPDAGHHGCMMRSPYAEVAHFLVVQRMLSRFKRLRFYTDASYDLTWSALVAMREGVRSGRVEIAVLQHEKIGRRDRAPVRRKRLPREEALPRAFADMEQRFEEKLRSLAEESAELPLWTQDRARVALWRHGPQGAQSENGKFAWLAYPADTQQYKNCNTLWLTRGPDQDLEDGRELLLGITLQSVDSACRSLRKRINSFKRPDKAARGVSYTDSGYRVEHALGELQVHLLQRNYSRRPGNRWSRTTIPASVAGLMGEDEDAIDMLALLWKFRLTIGHARETSEWMSL